MSSTVAVGFIAVFFTTRVSALPAVVDFAAAGLDPRADALLDVAFFLSAAAVLDLAFAATLFTEVFCAWLLLDREGDAGGATRLVADGGVAFVVLRTG